MVVSRQGIKFSFLMKHFNDCPLDMKTTDVVNNFIIPRTKSSQLSYCEYLAVNDKFVEGTVGPANLFISHAWEGEFHSLIDSVGQHLMQLDDGLSYEDTYVWVDIFSVNQHVVPNIVSTHLRTSIQEMIKSIGETLVIVENWKDPIPLRRGWCLWEIYCSHQSNVKFGFAMTTQKQIHFYYDCQENEIDLQSIIDSIDFEKSECSKIEDKQAITYAIQDC
jgi:hypothetical protein